MRRSHGNKEQTELQRANAEIKSLKKRISSLRKQLDRVDIDRYQNLRDVVDKQEAEDQEERVKASDAAKAKTWQCWTCHVGTLRITILERRDGTFYFRRCDGCGKRTKTQKYMAGKVEGSPDVKAEAVEGSERDKGTPG